MNFGLSEEQTLLKDTIRRFLAERCGATRVRAIMESDSGHDETLWRELAGLGTQALVVPERHGGAGLELLDLALAWESPGGLRPLSGVADSLTGGVEAGVSGLRPCSAPTPSPPDVEAMLAELSEAARAVLEHVLAAGGEATADGARHTAKERQAGDAGIGRGTRHLHVRHRRAGVNAGALDRHRIEAAAGGTASSGGSRAAGEDSTESDEVRTHASCPVSLR